MAIPEEEEHKKIINKNINFINTLLSISIFMLLCILILKHTSIIDKSFIFLLLFIQSVTLYICNVKWNQKLMLYVHYLYCVIIYFSMFSNNMYILIYFILVVVMNIYVWYVNDDSCIFGGLDWGNETFEYWGGYLFRIVPVFAIFKIINLYRKSGGNIGNIFNMENNSNLTGINQTKILENIIEKIPENVLDETITFDDLHNNLSKNIK